MSKGFESFVRPADKVGRVLYSVTVALAIFGGVTLGIVAVMTSISVSGRAAFSMPIPGDVELIELGTSTAVFAFLPFCQLVRGNVIVDFFLTWAPQRVKSSCDVLGTLVYLIVGGLLTWRLYYGAFEMYAYAETTGTLAIPRWFSFPYALVCMAILLTVIIYTLINDLAETKSGCTIEK